MVVKDAVIKAETLNKYLNGSFFFLFFCPLEIKLLQCI